MEGLIQTPTQAVQRSWLSTLRIRVPSTTQWEPVVAEQLMISFFAMPEPFKLSILATGQSLDWYITVPNRFEESVTNTLHARFPEAEVVPEPDFNHPEQFRTYYFEMAAPFVMPLKYAQDFTRVDPLGPILAVLGNLGPGEIILYEMILSPADKKVFKLGEKLITRSRISWFDYVTIDGAFDALFDRTSGRDKVSRYVPELQKLARAKLSTMLKNATLCLKVQSAAARRSDQLAGSVLPALAPIGRDGANYLIRSGKDSKPLILNPHETAALWHLPNELCRHQVIVWSRSPNAPLPHNFRQRSAGIFIGRNSYQSRTQPVTLPYPDRASHVSIFGMTNTGKSTLLHAMAHQDINNGHAVGIVDPHGQLAYDILAKSIPHHRECDVVLVDMTDPDYAVGLNILKAPRNIPPETVASHALSVIRKMFAESWSASRMEDALYATLSVLVQTENTTIQDIHRLFFDSSFRSKLLVGVSDPIALEFWYDEFEPASPALQREIARPISNRIRKFYRNQKIRRVIAQTESLDFRDIIDKGKIFIANLGGLSDIEAETLGALLISKFQVAAMSRGLYRQEHSNSFYLYIDEVQSFITTSLPKVLSEARKYGLHLVTANQFLNQLQGETLEAILGNVGSSIIFRLGPRDAHTLAPYTQPQFSNRDLVNLSRFNAVVKMQHSGERLPAFTMESLPPFPTPEGAWLRAERIRELSCSQYAKPKDEIDAALNKRYQEYRTPSGTQTINEDDSEEDYFG